MADPAPPDRQYIACAFRPGDTKGYTYFWDGSPLAPGDRVVVATKRGEQKVSVIGVVPEPPFETKGIVRVVDMPPVEMVAPENSTAMLDLPDDEIGI